MTQDVDQENLIERVRLGDDDAVVALHAHLWRRLGPYIRGKISAHLGARVDVEDILQQTILDILTIIKKGDRPITNLDALSKIIAGNLMAEYARRKSVAFQRLDSGGPPDPVAKIQSPGSRVLRRERRKLIEEAIDSLKLDQACIVRLRFFPPEGRKLTFGRIAEIVGMRPDAVQKSYQRSKRKIREYLERQLSQSNLFEDL